MDRGWCSHTVLPHSSLSRTTKFVPGSTTPVGGPSLSALVAAVAVSRMALNHAVGVRDVGVAAVYHRAREIGGDPAHVRAVGGEHLHSWLERVQQVYSIPTINSSAYRPAFLRRGPFRFYFLTAFVFCTPAGAGSVPFRTRQAG